MLNVKTIALLALSVHLCLSIVIILKIVNMSLSMAGIIFIIILSIHNLIVIILDHCEVERSCLNR